MTRPCLLCGSEDVVLVRSHTRGNVVERVLGRVDADVRDTATCRECGSRTPVSDHTRSADFGSADDVGAKAPAASPAVVSAVTRSEAPASGQARPSSGRVPASGSGAGRRKSSGGRASRRP